MSELEVRDVLLSGIPPLSGAPQPSVAPPPPAALTAAPGSRLEALLISYESTKAQFTETKARLDALVTALKTDMAASAPPGSTSIVLSGAPGLPVLRLRWRISWRCDVKKFRAERPELYVLYETQSGTWELRPEG